MFSGLYLLCYLLKKYDFVKVLPRKITARNPYSLEVIEKGEKKYVVIARTKTQKFYLIRSIKKQKEFEREFSDFFKVTLPDEKKIMYGYLYAVYPYIDGLNKSNDTRAVSYMKAIYSKYAQKVKVTQKVVKVVEDDLLDAWPPSFRDTLRQEVLFRKYEKIIKTMDTMLLYKEHGDFNCENVLERDGHLYLMDFEFAKSCQPIGQDIAEYKVSLSDGQVDEESIASLKVQICDCFNHIVDNVWYYRYVVLLENYLIFPILNRILKKVKKW